MHGTYCIDDGSDLRRGKVTSLLLPQEDMLERFISNLTGRHKSWRTTKKNMLGRVKHVSVCKWKGVTCDKDQTVRYIEWCSMNLLGTLKWELLPYTVVSCKLIRNRLMGTVELDTLPSSLSLLILADNTFTGELHLSDLPDTLQNFSVNDNKFEGSVDLTNLPSTLNALYLNNNQLSSAVDLSHLPDLEYLYLNNNMFTGPLSLGHLPASLRFANFYNNLFCGLVTFDGLPKGLTLLSLHSNKYLYGEIDRCVLPKTLRILEYYDTEIHMKST